jgi:predicted N-acyltransferase
MSGLRVEIRDGLAGVDRDAWDALVGDGSPFLEWSWLASLEESGCVAARTGWLPHHLTLWDGDRLIGACPLYLKGHSDGEFVFDHEWAAAAARGGIRYYPKLLVAVPFTPATGRRFLVHPDVDAPVVVRTLGSVLKEVCTENAFSSAHVNFCLPDEAAVLEGLGYTRRTGYQFHWTNPGWRTFDDYLAAFRSKRRVQVKRERRELAAQGITIETYTGDEIPDDLIEPMFHLYKSTIDKLYWGRQYLTLELFDLLRRRWKRRLCFVVAYRGGRIVAGTFNVRKGDTLYGRYWGTLEELRFLHFNVCYYATIDYCLREGIPRFEPGAGGEFKYLRGFEARPTDSMHFLADERLADAVRNYLQHERDAVRSEIAWLDERSPLKRRAGDR